MGANTFAVFFPGDDAEKAFWAAVEHAKFNHGNGGYTGTIAEKYEYVMMGQADGFDDAMRKARALEDDPRVNDKWGPAGCIEFTEDGKKMFCFFGWAPS